MQIGNSLRRRISSVAIHYVGVDVRVKFGDSSFRLTELFDSLPAAPVLHTFVQYLIPVCSRQEAASDVLSGRFVMLIVPDKSVAFCDLRFNRSGEIRSEAVGGGILP